MKTVSDFPREITEEPDLGIVLSDGCRLSARVWMPKDAAADPVPAILEYLPYRKRDGTAARDALTHPYLAGHGYACSWGLLLKRRRSHSFVGEKLPTLYTESGV